MYFLHAESHPGLSLELPSGSTATTTTMAVSALGTGDHHQQQQQQLICNQQPQAITQCIGKVIDKEYCYARKDENRYKVPRGTKFYRVKVRPRSPGRCTEPAGKCCSRRDRLDCNFCQTLLNKKRHSIK